MNSFLSLASSLGVDAVLFRLSHALPASVDVIFPKRFA